MNALRKVFPTGWKAVLALSLLAICVLFMAHHLDRPGLDRLEIGTRSASAPGGADPHSDRSPRSTRRAQSPHGTESPGKNAPEPVPGPEDGAVRQAADSSTLAEYGRAVTTTSGRVLDTAGQPIPAATVTLGEREVSTDSRGEFLMPRGAGDLVVRHPDYFSRHLGAAARRDLAQVTTAGGGERILVVLFRGGRVSGTVTDTDGQPIAGAAAGFSPLVRGNPGVATATTDDGGRYQSPLLHPGEYTVSVRHRDFQGRDSTVDVVSGRTARLDITLSGGTRLVVEVVEVVDGIAGGRDSAPHGESAQTAGPPETRGLADATVWVTTTDPDGSVEESRHLGRTNDQGILETRWGPSRPHRIRVTLPGYRERETMVQGNRVLLQLTPAPVISGTAIDRHSGLPVRPLDIRLEAALSPGNFRRAPDRGTLHESLQNGRFRIGLPPMAGSYRVVIHAEGSLFGSSATVTFDGSSSPRPITVALDPRGGLEGLVLHDLGRRDQKDVMPLPEVTLELFPAGHARRHAIVFGVRIVRAPEPLAICRTDTTGRFEFPDLEPGTYRIRATHRDLAEVLSGPVTVPSPTPLPLTMTRGASLTGRVVDARGEPAPGVPLILVSNERPFPRVTRSDDGGDYSITGLPDGTYVLFLGDPLASDAESVSYSRPGVHADGGSAAAEQHSLSIRDRRDVTYDIAMNDISWGSLRGLVTNSDTPLGDLKLVISGPEGGPSREVEIRTDLEGRYRLLGLTPGLYRVRCAEPPFVRVVSIESAATEVCTVRLRKSVLAISLVHGSSGESIRRPTRVQAFHVPGPGPEREAGPSPRGKRVAAAVLEDGSGTFELHPGFYRITARADGFLPLERSLEIPVDPWSPRQELALELQPGIRVRVFIRGETAGDEAGQKTAADTGGREEGGTPIRGLAELVLLRDEVEVHRSHGVIDGEVLLPTLEPGIYTMTIRSASGTVRSRFEVGPLPPPGAAAQHVRVKIPASASRR